MEKYMIYLIYTSILAIVLVLLVPKETIKKSAMLGIICGAIGDVVVILLLGLLNIGEYLNYGPFHLEIIPFFPPFAWTIWYILYFYFLPDQKYLRYIYVFSAASYSTMFSNVLAHLGIFKWNYSNVILPFIIYLTWISISTFGTLKLQKSLCQDEE